MEVSNYQVLVVKIRTDRQDFGSGSIDYINSWFSKWESSFKGHTVNALVLTGDEGRGQLR